jgi:hypothetical protein
MVVSPNQQGPACTQAIACGGRELCRTTARIPGDDQRPRASNRQSRSKDASCLLPRSPVSHISHRPSLHPITYLHGCGGGLGGASIKVNDEQPTWSDQVLWQLRVVLIARDTTHVDWYTYRYVPPVRNPTYHLVATHDSIRLSNSFDLNAYVDGLRVSTRRFWRRAEVTQAVTPLRLHRQLRLKKSRATYLSVALSRIE